MGTHARPWRLWWMTASAGRTTSKQLESRQAARKAAQTGNRRLFLEAGRAGLSSVNAGTGEDVAAGLVDVGALEEAYRQAGLLFGAAVEPVGGLSGDAQSIRRLISDCSCSRSRPARALQPHTRPGVAAAVDRAQTSTASSSSSTKTPGSCSGAARYISRSRVQAWTCTRCFAWT
jgi:hypothetical protein